MNNNSNLKVKTESGREIEIKIIDIIDSKEYNKEYVIYTIIGDEENIYASVLIENDNNFELTTIPTQEEYDLINKTIEEIDIENIN